jgi:hypothetical protein
MLAKLNNAEKLKYYYEEHVSWFPESKEELNKYNAWLKMKNGNLTN